MRSPSSQATRTIHVEWVAVVAAVVQWVHFARMPLDAKLAYVPDDGFYYLQLAREFQRSGRWSFDGESLTSGFHPLFGYLCAASERLFGNTSIDARLCIHTAVATVLTCVSVLWMGRVMRRVFPAGVTLAVLFVGLAGAIMMCPLLVMEWPFVVVCATGAAWSFSERRERWLFAFVLVGCAARTDFPVNGAAIVVACVWAFWREREKAYMRLAGASALASFLGGALAAAHSYAISGHLLQSSARVKAHWGSVKGYSIASAADAAAYTLSPAYVLIRPLDLGPATVFAVFGLLAIVAFSVRNHLRTLATAKAALIVYSVTAIALFCVVYGTNSAAAMLWYSAEFWVPMFCLVAALASLLGARAKLGALVLGALCAAVNLVDGWRPTWREHAGVEDARVLRNDAAITRAGSWNAGWLAYAGGEKVVNLDGLVNDDIVDDIIHDRVHCFVAKKQLRYIVDWGNWLEPSKLKYLGVSNGKLVHAMKLEDHGFLGRVVWRVDLEELNADPSCGGAPR